MSGMRKLVETGKINNWKLKKNLELKKFEIEKLKIKKLKNLKLKIEK